MLDNGDSVQKLNGDSFIYDYRLPCVSSYATTKVLSDMNIKLCMLAFAIGLSSCLISFAGKKEDSDMLSLKFMFTSAEPLV